MKFFTNCKNYYSPYSNDNGQDISVPTVAQGTLFAIRTTAPLHRADKLFLLEHVE